jgi:urease gamma subunit
MLLTPTEQDASHDIHRRTELARKHRSLRHQAQPSRGGGLHLRRAALTAPAAASSLAALKGRGSTLLTTDDVMPGRRTEMLEVLNIEAIFPDAPR